MKVPPKRKGNLRPWSGASGYSCLNESPSQKEGKFAHSIPGETINPRLNESPSKKEGKSGQV